MKRLFAHVCQTRNGKKKGVFNGTRNKEVFKAYDLEDFLENCHLDEAPETTNNTPPPDRLNQRMSDALRGAQINQKLHFYSSAQKRIISMMFMSELANHHIELKRVSKTLDRELTLEALCLNIPLLATPANWTEGNPIFDPEWYGHDDNNVQLDKMTGIRLFESLGKEDPLRIVYTLNSLLYANVSLLRDIGLKIKKIRNTDQQKCEDFFTHLEGLCDKQWVEYILKRITEDVADDSLQTYQNLQLQLIAELLNTGFCRHLRQPIGADVKKRSIVISDDALAHGTQLTETMAVECAKFERFAKMKNGLLTLNKCQITKHIIDHFAKLQEADFQNICHFSIMNTLLQQEMVRLCPQLRRQLEQQMSASSLVAMCQKALKPLKPYLHKDVRESVPGEFVAWLLYDSAIKEEARNKLCGKSGSKYLCEMVLVLSLTGVYGAEADTKTMTAALMPAMGRLPQTTVRRYLQGVKEVRGGSLYACASTKIEELMKKPYNALAGLIK